MMDGYSMKKSCFLPTSVYARRKKKRAAQGVADNEIGAVRMEWAALILCKSIENKYILNIFT